MNLNTQHIENNSFITKGEKENQEMLKARLKEDVAEYKKNNPRKFIHKIFLNHSKEWKEFKDISETEKEKEEIWGEKFIY